MRPEQHFKYSTATILYPLLIVFALWLVFWYQIRIDGSIRYYGIRPQQLEGLLGVFTSPFLHSDMEHLYNNSIPLFVLTLALFYFYNKIAWKVLVFGIVGSGLLTWLIGSNGNHIGASGLVYVLVSFIFFKGIFAKHYRLIALSLMVIFLYGSLIWYVFPIKDGMSWEGHLGGLITGLAFALIFRKQVAKPERYIWEDPAYNEEEDEFMKHFDEHGNFVEYKEQPEEQQHQASEHTTKGIRINYIFKTKEKD